MGWISGISNHGDGRLLSIRDVFVTSTGLEALQRLRRESARTEGIGGTLPESLEEKRSMRAAFMRLLYDETNGSTIATANEKELGAKLGWDESTTDLIAEYLMGERLLEYVAYGGTIGITHAGVVEVEEAMRAPTQSTHHFAAFNQINIGTATNVGVQQGTTNSTQNVTVINQDHRKQLIGLLDDVRSTVGAWPNDDPLRVEAEQAVEVARKEIESGADASRVRSALNSLAGVIIKGAALGTSAETLLQLVQKLMHSV